MNFNLITKIAIKHTGSRGKQLLFPGDILLPNFKVSNGISMSLFVATGTEFKAKYILSLDIFYSYYLYKLLQES